MGFKDDFPFDKRTQESFRVRVKYNRVACIVEPAPGAEHIAVSADAKKKKYLVPPDFTVGQFVYVLRSKMKMTAEQSLFLFLPDNTLPPVSQLMSVLDAQHRDADGFLYVKYAAENTFGYD